MKTFTTTLLFIAVFTCSAQEDSLRWHDTMPMFRAGQAQIIYFSPGSMKNITYSYRNYETNLSISFDDSAKHISIMGDTIEVIRMMLQIAQKDWHIRDSVEQVYQNAFYAGIAFLNELPDYYKQYSVNCKWPEYWRLLANMGFAKSRKTNTKSDCK